MNTHAALVDTLAQSEPFRKYAHAFTKATGLPLGIRPADCWNPDLGAQKKGKSYCALIARTNAGCAARLRTQDRLAEAALNGPALLKCECGLYEGAVPVKLGPQVIGFLITGQIHLQEPTREQVAKMLQTVERHGLGANRDEIKGAYLNARVMPRKQFEAILGLLAMFAEQLAAMSNLITTRAQNSEPTPVLRAKEYIRQNLQEDLRLTEIAKAACTSTFYICKLFKKHTGLNLTEYVSRLRVERTRELLANPQLRVSEIAFEVGFQSLTHFNRVFRKIVGEAPTDHREHLNLPVAA